MPWAWQIIHAKAMVGAVVTVGTAGVLTRAMAMAAAVSSPLQRHSRMLWRRPWSFSLISAWTWAVPFRRVGLSVSFVATRLQVTTSSLRTSDLFVRQQVAFAGHELVAVRVPCSRRPNQTSDARFEMRTVLYSWAVGTWQCD